MKSTSKPIENLKWRYATKKYDVNKKISEEDFNTLKEALILSPSSYGLQPWKFVVVKNPEVRKKLQGCSYGQTPIVESSHLIVICALKNLDEKYVDKFLDTIDLTRGYKEPSVALKDGFNREAYKKMMLSGPGSLPKEQQLAWTKHQCYIAVGMLLSAAAEMRIDATPMEGFEPIKYDEILGLTNYTSTVVVALGYRAQEDTYAKLKKVRFTEKELFKVI